MQTNRQARTSRGGAVASLFAVVGLIGCSALQVDVDVYKGPLTSQREVQLRQFSTLALAAKPLLADLRNAAERKKTGFELTRPEQREFLWKFYDYEYTDDVARFANGALSFYEDVEPAGGLQETKKADAINQRFQKALQSFNVVHADCELANDISPSNDLNKAVARFFRAGALGTSGSGDQSAVCLHSARTASVVTSSAALGKRQIEQVQEALCKKLGPRSTANNVCSSKSVSFAYELLAEGPRKGAKPEDPEVLAVVVAKEVAPQDKALQSRLELRLREIGSSFQVARTEMAKLWKSSNILVKEAYQRLPRSNAQLASAFMANTTEPRILACFLSKFPDEGGVDPRVRQLVLEGVTQDWSSPDDTERRTDKFRKANEVLEGVAHRYPYETVQTLTSIDAKLRTFVLDDSQSETLASCEHYKSAKDGGAELRYASKHYGLARGTAVDNEFDSVLEGIVERLASLTSASRYGFDEGRPRAGIVGLTTTYLEGLSREQTRDTRVAVQETRRKLEETLITFAERLLYIANNAGLVNRDVNTDAELARNAALLQAVGNTIVVLVDDIRRQADHDRASESRRGMEAVAINRAFAGQPAATFDALMVEINATAKRLQAEASRTNVRKDKAAAAAYAASSAAERLQAELTIKQTALATKKGTAQAAETEALRFRAAVITVAAPKSSKNYDNKPDEPTAATDRKSIGSKVSALPATTTADAVLAAVKKWISDQVEIDKPGGVDARLERLTTTKAFFESSDITFPGLPEGAPDVVFTEIKRRLVDWLARREQAVKDLVGERNALAEQVKVLEGRLIAEKGTTAASEGQVKAEGEKLTAENASAADLAAALQAIKEVREAVLAKATGADAANPSNLTQILAAELSSRAEAAKGTEAAKRFVLAAEYVSRTSPTSVLSVLADGDGRASRSTGANRRTQVDVLDDLIAQLRHQRIQALAAGDDGRAKNYEEALKAAFDQRGSMAYLRPTGSYLRNVYAATALQADPDIGYTNLLIANAKRIFGPVPESVQARVSVEKQFWQNINTVQVGSGGAANYVLVKDDVGNWYLKAVASDTSSIIQSAQSLALFNMGRKYDVNLLRRTELQRRIDAPETSEDERSRARADLGTINQDPKAGSGASTSGLSSVQKKYQEGYAKQVGTDVASLQTAAAKLNDNLIAAWKRDLKSPTTEFLQVLEAMVTGESDEQRIARERLETVATQPEADRAAAGADAIIDALRSLRRMRDRMNLQISGSGPLVSKPEEDLKSTTATFDALKAAGTKSDDPKYKEAEEAVTKARVALEAARANRTQAAKSAVAAINLLVSSTVARRLDAVKTAETAFAFIGEAATAP